MESPELRPVPGVVDDELEQLPEEHLGGSHGAEAFLLVRFFAVTIVELVRIMGMIRTTVVSQSQLVLVVGNDGAVVVTVTHVTTCVNVLFGEQVIKRGSGADVGDGVGSIVPLAALDGGSPFHRRDVF